MQLRDYTTASEVGRGVARENVKKQIEDLKGILARYWTVEAFTELHKQFPTAARITATIETNEDGTSSVDPRTVYDTDGVLLWDADTSDDEIESPVRDFLAAADEYVAFDLTTQKTIRDGFSEAVLADQYETALDPRAQVMAALNLRTYPADEEDGDFRTVLEVRGITVDVRILRTDPDATDAHTVIDLDAGAADVQRPVVVTTNDWTTELHTFE